MVSNEREIIRLTTSSPSKRFRQAVKIPLADFCSAAAYPSSHAVPSSVVIPLRFATTRSDVRIASRLFSKIVCTVSEVFSGLSRCGRNVLNPISGFY